MGSYLSKPITEKYVVEGRNNKLSYAACTMQGWRRFHEDTFDCNIQLRKDVSLFAVYDGHGGVEVAAYCKEQLPAYIRKHWDSQNIPKTLKDAILDLDNKLRQPSTKPELESIVKAFSEELVDRDIMLPNVIEDEEEKESDQDEESENYRDEESESPLPGANPLFAKMTAIVKDMVHSADNEESDEDAHSGGEYDENPESPVNSTSDQECEDQDVLCCDKEESDDDVHSDRQCDENSESSVNSEAADQSTENNPSNETGNQDINEEGDDREVERTENSDHEEGDDREVERTENSDYEERVAREMERRENSEHSDHSGYSCGTTAVVALMTKTRLYVANVGDSRCVVSRNGRVHEMTEDHKPTLPGERERILKAGGSVVKKRVCGTLALSRALGDHSFKNENLMPCDQMVSGVPDVKVLEMDPDIDDFIFLATDGIWDVLTNEEATDFIWTRLKTMSLSAICEEMFDTVIAPVHSEDELGLDNMTCIIVKPNFSNSSESSTVVCDKRSLSEEDDNELKSSKKRSKKSN